MRCRTTLAFDAVATVAWLAVVVVIMPGRSWMLVLEALMATLALVWATSALVTKYRGELDSRGISIRRSEVGAAAPLELAVIAVPVLAVVMLIVFLGRLVIADGTLDGIAHYGAREAARARSAGDADAAASSAVDADMAAAGLECDGTGVEVDTGNFRAGGTVAVRVTCQVRISDLVPLPVPGTTTVESRAVATVDVFRGTR